MTFSMYHKTRTQYAKQYSTCRHSCRQRQKIILCQSRQRGGAQRLGRERLSTEECRQEQPYNFSRKNLNFEITKGGKIVQLGFNPIPLHERIQMRLDELGFKPYMDAKPPNQVSKNSPNCTVSMIFSGDHDVLYNLAFGNYYCPLNTTSLLPTH